ncbi:MAG: hypothetical protein A4E65_02036 [Syntrophorhabdus sp. PtaU1.Bin153]|nr:MAG: hypothetical protein A4E65_02036 [Syntrophorhabdus sp. PtaU1.Bin153]
MCSKLPFFRAIVKPSLRDGENIPLLLASFDDKVSMVIWGVMDVTEIVLTM